MQAARTTPYPVHGIPYDNAFVEQLNISTAAVAGLFRLSNTSELVDILKSLEGVLDTYLLDRKNGYGQPRYDCFIMTDRLLRIPDEFPVRDLLADEKNQPRQEQWSTKFRFNEIRTLWYILRMMEARQDLFPRSQVLDKSAEAFVLDKLDILHAWALMDWLWNQHNSSGLLSAKIEVGPMLVQHPIYYIPGQGGLGGNMRGGLSGNPISQVGAPVDALSGLGGVSTLGLSFLEPSFPGSSFPGSSFPGSSLPGLNAFPGSTPLDGSISLADVGITAEKEKKPKNQKKRKLPDSGKVNSHSFNNQFPSRTTHLPNGLSVKRDTLLHRVSSVPTLEDLLFGVKEPPRQGQEVRIPITTVSSRGNVPVRQGNSIQMPVATSSLFSAGLSAPAVQPYTFKLTMATDASSSFGFNALPQVSPTPSSRKRKPSSRQSVTPKDIRGSSDLAMDTTGVLPVPEMLNNNLVDTAATYQNDEDPASKDKLQLDSTNSEPSTLSKLADNIDPSLMTSWMPWQTPIPGPADARSTTVEAKESQPEQATFPDNFDFILEAQNYVLPEDFDFEAPFNADSDAVSKALGLGL